MSIIGQKGAFRHPARWGRTEQGQFYEWTYEGTKNEIAAQAALLDSQGFLYEVEETWGKARLTARLPYNPNAGGGGTEAPVDLWEFISGREQKDLLEADVPTGITATLSQKNIELLRKVIQDPPSGTASGNYNPTTNPEGSVVAACFTDGNPTNALTIYNLMKAGVRSAIVQTPTLRHTQTVSNNWAIPAANTNVGRVISTASIVSLEGVPSGLLFNLPNAVPASFQTISVDYGWLKHGPNVQQIAGRKWQLTQEWEYGLWPLAIVNTIL